jgi:asparagine synthase (glutamine-hydrolysing)
VGLYQVGYGLYTQDFLRDLVRESVRTSATNGLPPDRLAELSDLAGSGTAHFGVSRLELALFLGERLLRDTDVASMASSLEVRVPLLDHRVVEAVEAMPNVDRFVPLGRKQLLRSLAMPHLDPSLFDRPKAGFVLPIEIWAKDQLADAISTLFQDRTLVEGVGLYPAALGRLWQAFQAGAPGLYWSRIWAPFVLLDWCKRHNLSLA